VPLFIDRHDNFDSSAEDLAAAHERDLAAQGRHGVSYLTYWFDPDAGTVFCLADGPNREAVENVHREAHGETACAIVEIPPGLPVEKIFGGLHDQSGASAEITPAVRAILFTDLCDSVAQTQALGDDGHVQLLREHDEIVRSQLAAHHGREVKHTGDGIMASFTSVSSAVACGIGVQQKLAVRNEEATTPLTVSIGISAGEPVTDDNDDLFGAAVQLAARLCAAASSGDIMASVAVRELCIGKGFSFAEHDPLELKGMHEPVRAYAVTWRE
jgi:class 3 adenylate cyclase